MCKKVNANSFFRPTPFYVNFEWKLILKGYHYL